MALGAEQRLVDAVAVKGAAAAAPIRGRPRVLHFCTGRPVAHPQRAPVTLIRRWMLLHAVSPPQRPKKKEDEIAKEVYKQCVELLQKGGEANLDQPRSPACRVGSEKHVIVRYKGYKPNAIEPNPHDET